MRIIRRDARAQDSCLRFTWSLEGFSAPPSWKNKRFTGWNGAVVAVCLRDALSKKKKKGKKNMQIERRRPVFLGSERGKETFGNRVNPGFSLSLSCSFHSLLSFLLFLLSLFSFSLFSGPRYPTERRPNLHFPASHQRVLFKIVNYGPARKAATHTSAART